MAEIDVRLDHVTKRFGDVIAVDNLSLDIRHGEFFSLLGPSGCGKTTTLRMLAGFDDATSGRIFLGGEDVTSLPPFKRDINTVFQDYALFPHLSVHDNVAFGPRRRGASGKDLDTRVGEMLELVQLGSYGKRKPGQLSGGQRQRVALARALINRPRVLLLDVPLGALDLKLRRQMQSELKRIQSEVGITFLFVTHDQEEAMTMSDRIGVMNAGRLEQVDTPESMYERPSTQFVAGFLGASNLLSGEVVGRTGDLVELKLATGAKVLAPSPEASSAVATPVMGSRLGLGVRPEKLRLVAESALTAVDNNHNVLLGTIGDASFVGVSTQYTVRTDDGSELIVYAQNAGGDSKLAGGLRPGDRVRVSWEPRHTYLLVPPADVPLAAEQPVAELVAS